MSLLQVLGLPSSPAVATKAAPHGAAGGTAKADAKGMRLSTASEAWRQTHRLADQRIAALKASAKSHYSDLHPELLQAIEQGLEKLDEVLDTVDHRLADALVAASTATDALARSNQLASAKSILTDYVAYMKGDNLVAHIDENPFKVKTELKTLLVEGLTRAAKAIG